MAKGRLIAYHTTRCEHHCRYAARLLTGVASGADSLLVASACADRNAICSLEMGGKNVIMVMEDADIDLAVEGAVWGAFGTSGQRCTASM
jgi:aldehyde dehydrogenase (NAD+)